MTIKTIISLVLVGAIVIGAYYLIKKVDFSEFSNGFKIPNPFENLFGEPDNSSSLAGSEIIEEDGTIITIPDDNMVNPDGTVEGSPPEITLDPETEKKIKDSIAENRQSAENAKKALQKLDESTNAEYLEEITRIGKLDTPRDTDYYIARGFKSGHVMTRVAQSILNSKQGKYRSNKTGQTISYGGYSSAFEQEKALRKTYEKNKKLYPKYFGRTITPKTETVTAPVINRYSSKGKKLSKKEEDNIKKTQARQRSIKRSNRRQQKKIDQLRSATDSSTAIEYLRKRGRR